MFEGEPDLSQLGDERKFKRLGQLSSPFGMVFVELHFRTKMEIQPQPFVEEESAAIQNVNNPPGELFAWSICSLILDAIASISQPFK